VSTVIVEGKKSNVGCLVQLLWFLFVGWWVGQLWIALAWLLMVLIIGIPLGVKMMNKVPQVIALRGESTALRVSTVGDKTVVSAAGPVPQHSLVLRALYFLLVGWWFSAVWIELAYLLCLTIVGLPVGFWMFDRVPAIVSLRR